MRPIRYDWHAEIDDDELVSTDQILTAYEDGRIGAARAIERLELSGSAELQDVMDFNGRTMPWARPMVLSAATKSVLEAALLGPSPDRSDDGGGRRSSCVTSARR